MSIRTAGIALGVVAISMLPAAYGQVTGQPASDVLMSYDIWGNPTPRGGVTNGGTTSHSVW